MSTYNFMLLWRKKENYPQITIKYIISVSIRLLPSLRYSEYLMIILNWRQFSPVLHQKTCFVYSLELPKFEWVPTTYVFVEKYRKLSPNYHQTPTIWAIAWQNQQNECAPREDSDQPGHPPSLISVLAVRMKKPRVLSYPLSAQWRFWSDWADSQADPSLHWMHIHFVDFVMSWLISISQVRLLPLVLRSLQQLWLQSLWDECRDVLSRWST